MPQRQRESAAEEFIQNDPCFLGYVISMQHGPQTTWHVVTPRSPINGDRVYGVHQDNPVVGLYRGVHIEGDQQVYRIEETRVIGVIVATMTLPRNPEEKGTPSQDVSAESCETTTANP